MRYHPHTRIPNPYRRVAGRETKTWLPDDAGKYTDPNAEIGLEFTPDMAELAGQFVLPDGKRIDVKMINLGDSSVVYLGSDGWVYALTKNDPLKEILVAAARDTADKLWAVHLPWIERIGVTAEHRPRTVYRLPVYTRISASSDKWDEMIRFISGVKEFLPSDELKVKFRTDPMFIAYFYLKSAVADAGFSPDEDLHYGNFMLDPEKNIVLLDVFSLSWRRR